MQETRDFHFYFSKEELTEDETIDTLSGPIASGWAYTGQHVVSRTEWGTFGHTFTFSRDVDPQQDEEIGALLAFQEAVALAAGMSVGRVVTGGVGGFRVIALTPSTADILAHIAGLAQALSHMQTTVKQQASTIDRLRNGY